jgi:hypothetical protein
LALKLYKRLKVKLPKKPYMPAQSPYGLYTVPNFPDLASDLSVYLYNKEFLRDSTLKEAELGPVYAVCENFIRYNCIDSGASDATEADVIIEIEKLAPSLDNFQLVKILNIVRKYKKKYGNNKWLQLPRFKRVQRNRPNR